MISFMNEMNEITPVTLNPFAEVLSRLDSTVHVVVDKASSYTKERWTSFKVAGLLGLTLLMVACGGSDEQATDACAMMAALNDQTPQMTEGVQPDKAVMDRFPGLVWENAETLTLEENGCAIRIHNFSPDIAVDSEVLKTHFAIVKDFVDSGESIKGVVDGREMEIPVKLREGRLVDIVLLTDELKAQLYPNALHSGETLTNAYSDHHIGWVVVGNNFQESSRTLITELTQAVLEQDVGLTQNPKYGQELAANFFGTVPHLDFYGDIIDLGHLQVSPNQSVHLQAWPASDDFMARLRDLGFMLTFKPIKSEIPGQSGATLGEYIPAPYKGEVRLNPDLFGDDGAYRLTTLQSGESLVNAVERIDGDLGGYSALVTLDNGNQLAFTGAEGAGRLALRAMTMIAANQPELLLSTEGKQLGAVKEFFGQSMVGAQVEIGHSVRINEQIENTRVPKVKLEIITDPPGYRLWYSDRPGIWNPFAESGNGQPGNIYDVHWIPFSW
jgi:hypothetical protein